MVKVSDVECDDLEKVGTRTISKDYQGKYKRKEERGKRKCVNIITVLEYRSDVEGGRNSVKHNCGMTMEAQPPTTIYYCLML